MDVFIQAFHKCDKAFAPDLYLIYIHLQSVNNQSNSNKALISKGVLFALQKLQNNV